MNYPSNSDEIVISSISHMTGSDDFLENATREAIEAARAQGTAQKLDSDDPVYDMPEAVDGWAARSKPTGHVGYGDTPFDALLDLTELLSETASEGDAATESTSA